jgi:ABC-2 type transport system permease protein
MTPMLRKALWDLRWTTLWYGLVAVLYTGAILAYYPYVRDNAASFSKILETYPRSLMDAFGVSDIASFSGFLGSEVFNVIWPVLMAAFAITAGSAIVAREIEEGTADLWLSVPAGRTLLLGGKLLALGLAIVALVAASLLPVALGAAVLAAHVTAGGVLSLGLVMTSFVLIVAAYSALFSAFSSDRGRAAGLAGGLSLVFYLAWVVSRISPDWSWLGKLSIFTAYEPQRALASGGVDATKVAVLMALAAVAVAVALLRFQRRDLLA